MRLEIDLVLQQQAAHNKSRLTSSDATRKLQIGKQNKSDRLCAQQLKFYVLSPQTGDFTHLQRALSVSQQV